RQMFREIVEKVRNAVALRRRDHESPLERKKIVPLFRKRKQRFALHKIDLVQDQNFRLAQLLQLLDDRARLVIKTLLRVDQERREIRIRRARERSRYHRAVEPPLRRENSRRIDENDLRLVLDRDSANQASSRLHLRRNDRDFQADER